MRPTDPATSLESLLAERTWLQALARSLVRDESEADDVAQETWLAALRGAPARLTNARGWLAAVLRNVLRDRRRAESSRARRESAVARPEAADDPDVVARADAHLRLAQSVHDLDEPYRTTVLLRYFDGLAVAEIAARLGTSEDAVRMRLRRAIARLREELREEDRRAWAVLLAPGPRAAPTAAGGGLAIVKVAGTLAAVALIAVGWSALTTDRSGDGRLQDTATVDSASQRPESAVRRERGAVADEQSPAIAAEPAPSDGRPQRWVLRGRIDGVPADRAAPVRVAVYALHSEMTTEPVPVHIDAMPDRRFELDLSTVLAATPRPTRLVTVIDDPAWLPAGASVDVPEQLAADATGASVLECRIEVHPAAQLTVRVVDDTGAAVAGAWTAVYPMAEGLPAEYPLDRTDTDAAGSSRLRLAPAAKHLVLAVTPGRAPAIRSVVAGADDTITLTLERGETISGAVTEDGVPVAGAELRIRADTWHGLHLHLNADRGVSVDWLDGRVFATEIRAKSDERGRYRFTGLTEGAHTVEVLRRPPGQELTGFRLDADAPSEDADAEIAAAHVVVEVRSDGRPVAGVGLIGVGGEFIPKTGENGCIDAMVAPGRRCQIQTERDGFRTKTVQFVAGEAGSSQTVAITLDAVPRHGTLAIVVKAPDGHPIDPFGLAFSTGETKPWNAIQRFGRGADGRFVVTDVDAGSYRLVVRPGRDWAPDFTWDGDAGTWLDESIDVAVPADGEKEIVVTARSGGRLRIAARNAAGAFLAARCEIRDAAGAAVPVHFATRYGAGGAHSMGEGSLGEHAPTDVAEALTPGEYRVTLSLDGGTERVVDAEVVAGRTCVLDVTIDAGTDAAPPAREAAAPAQPR